MPINHSKVSKAAVAAQTIVNEIDVVCSRIHYRAGVALVGGPALRYRDKNIMSTDQPATSEQANKSIVFRMSTVFRIAIAQTFIPYFSHRHVLRRSVVARAGNIGCVQARCFLLFSPRARNPRRIKFSTIHRVVCTS